MLTQREIVLRELLVAHQRGNPRWDSYAQLAEVSGVPGPTVYQALQPLREIGTVQKLARGGFAVIQPEKILTLICASRTPLRDLAGYLAPEDLPSIRADAILTGPDAVLEIVGGLNTIGSLGQRMVYLPPGTDVPLSPAASESSIMVLVADPRLISLSDAGVAPIPTVHADLFATPGWQAAAFLTALNNLGPVSSHE